MTEYLTEFEKWWKREGVPTVTTKGIKEVCKAAWLDGKNNKIIEDNQK